MDCDNEEGRDVKLVEAAQECDTKSYSQAFIDGANWQRDFGNRIILEEKHYAAFKRMGCEYPIKKKL